MILKSVETPRGVIVNVPEREAREIFGASNEAITAARREVMLEVLRNERNALLRACDWTQVPDAALTTEQKAAWTKYRKMLRDLPSVADLDKEEWPVAPA